MKNVLYLGYWNLDDPLTQSTIFPNLEILSNFKNIDSIHFLNTQREEPSKVHQSQLKQIGVSYKALYSLNIKFNLLNKINDFYLFPREISKYCINNNIDFIISRGAPAGVLAYKSTRNLRIPFIVESFEPHADYMRFSGTWKVYDPRYIFQKKWEKQVKLKAQNLLTVSQNYKEQLIAQGVNRNKIEVVPCVVNHDLFFPDKKIKIEMREKLKLPKESTVGVYAGKFGNLYHDLDAFKLFKEAYESLNDFYLLLLSNENDEFINSRLKEFKIPNNRLIKRYVKHNEMPEYLNTADFAFATIKDIKVSKFQSPVKIGEYWACGLPILLSGGVGDESGFIESEKGGILIHNYELSTLKEVINRLKVILNSTITSMHYHKLALKYRNFDQIKTTYKKVLRSEIA